MFRGWRVVGSVFVMLAIGAGFGFYGLPLYLSKLHDERGFSITAMSGATAVFFAVSGVAGIAVARLLRRFDPRPIVVAGGLVCTVAILLLGRVHSLWQVYVVYALFGTGYAFNGLVVSTTVVARWFDRRRPLALSIASTGLSVGGITVTPFAKRFIDAHQISGGMWRIAIVYVLGSIPIPLLFLRADPGAYGLEPDGERTADARPDGEARAVTGVTFEEAIRSVVFVAITLGFLLSLLAQVGGIAQLFRVTKERVDAHTAAQAVSLMAFASVTGRLSGSVLMPKFGSRRFTMVVLGGQAIGLLGLAGAQQRWSILLFSAMFGLMVGNVLLLHPLLLAEAFGIRDYARVYSRSQMMTSFGVALGPLLLGYLRDNAGGYTAAYLAAAGLSAAGFTVYGLWARERPSALAAA